MNGNNHRYPSDYVMIDSYQLNDEVLIIDLHEKISYDSLTKVLIQLSSWGARVVVVCNDSSQFFGSEQGLIDVLKIRDDYFVTPNTFKNPIDLSRDGEKSDQFLGVNSYETLELQTSFNLVTSFDAYNEDSGFKHIAYLAAKAYHPRYNSMLEKNNSDNFEIRYFGNEYWSFFVGRLYELDNMIKPLVGNRIVIIGSLNEPKYFTPVRFFYENKDFSDSPDMSDPIVLANAILTLLNQELITYPKWF